MGAGGMGLRSGGRIWRPGAGEPKHPLINRFYFENITLLALSKDQLMDESKNIRFGCIFGLHIWVMLKCLTLLTFENIQDPVKHLWCSMEIWYYLVWYYLILFSIKYLHGWSDLENSRHNPLTPNSWVTLYYPDHFVKDHSCTTFAKFPEKLTFVTSEGNKC